MENALRIWLPETGSLTRVYSNNKIHYTRTTSILSTTYSRRIFLSASTPKFSHIFSREHYPSRKCQVVDAATDHEQFASSKVQAKTLPGILQAAFFSLSPSPTSWYLTLTYSSSPSQKQYTVYSV